MKLRAFDVGDESLQPAVVKTQSVDQGILFRNAEHARLGVARLRQGRDRAYFDKAKTHRFQAVDAAGIFVQACGQANAVGECQSGKGHRVIYALLLVSQRQRGVLRFGQAAHGQVMCGLGVQAK